MSTTTFVAISAPIAAILGFAIGNANLSLVETMVWATGTIWIAFCLLWAIKGSSFDILEPVWITAVAMSFMFFMRPLSLLGEGIYLHRGYEIRSTVAEASTLAFIGSLAWIAGYVTPWSRSIGETIRPLPTELNTNTLVKLAFSLGATGLVLYGVFLMESGGFGTLFWFLSGRETGQDLLHRSSSGYFYQGPLLLIPAGLLLFSLGFAKDDCALKWVGLMLMVPVIILKAGVGGRLVLMVALTGFVVFWMLWSKRRPSLLGLLAGGYLVLTVGIGFLGTARVVETRTQPRWQILIEMLIHPGAAIRRLTVGGDLDMFDALANLLTVVPEKLPFQPGSLFYDPVIRFVPRQLWPGGQPLEANDRWVALQWPEMFKINRAGPASSFLGQLYQDSGVLSVIVGMLILGTFMRAIWAWRVKWEHNYAVQMVYAAMLPYVIVLLRGNVTHVLSTSMFTLFPLLLALWWARSRPADKDVNYRSHSVTRRGTSFGQLISKSPLQRTRS